MARLAEHKRKFGVVFADDHLDYILRLQKVELFQRLFKVMNSAKELSRNANIFEGVIGVEGMTCLIEFPRAPWDVAFKLVRNEYRQRVSMQLEVQHLRSAA